MARVRDPTIIDANFQKALLLKTDWPNVVTKQALKDKKIKCIEYYGNDEDGRIL